MQALDVQVTDASELDQLLLRVRRKGCTVLQGEKRASWVSENALLVLTATETGKETPVGLFAIFHSPGLPEDELSWATTEADNLGFSAASTAWARVVLAVRHYEAVAVRAMLREAFIQMPHLKTILLTQSEPLTAAVPGLTGHFMPASQAPGSGCHLYECSRGAVVPQLRIRVARVDDHDDLLPLVQQAALRCPALAQLPNADEGVEDPYALAHLIASQDASSCVLVAEHKGRLVGLLAGTSDVDVRPLLRGFDLHAFDQFMDAEDYEMRLKAAMAQRTQRSAAKAASADAAAAGEREADGAAGSAAEFRVPETPQGLLPSPRRRWATARSCIGTFRQAEESAGRSTFIRRGGSAPELPPGLLEDVVPEPGDIDHVVRELQEATAAPECLAFAMTMLCMDAEFEGQAAALLRTAFELISARDFCLCTLPEECPEHPLLRQFVRLLPSSGAEFSEALYVFQRHGFMEDWRVRSATQDDVEAVATLLAGLSSRYNVFGSFLNVTETDGAALVAEVAGQVVGLLTLQFTTDLLQLQTHFDLSGVLDAAQHDTLTGFADMEVCCMNPIFAHRTGEFLVEAMRKLKRTCLLHLLPPDQGAPEVLRDFRQVPARHLRSWAKHEEGAHALFVYTHRWAHRPRRAVNTPLLVAGASECGLAALERLVLHPQLCFNSLTLLAPGGVACGGVGSDLTPAMLAQLGLHASVNTIDAELVGLDRQQRVAVLSTGQQLRYSLLLLTAGLQDQTLARIAAGDEAEDAPVASAQGLAELTPEEAAKMGSIVVYGNTLEAYDAVAQLEALEVKSGTVRHVLPPGPQGGMVSVLHDCVQMAKAELLPTETLQLVSARALYGGEKVEMTFQDPAAAAAAGSGSSGVLPPGRADQPAGCTQVASAADAPSEDGSTPRSDGQLGMQTVQADLLVLADEPDVHPSLAACFAANSLVWDGRLVVDAQLRTNDDHIYAAGTLAKFSRRYGAHLLHQYYSSQHLGTCLADAVVRLFTDPLASRSDCLPQLRSARVTGARLPGGRVFAFAGLGAAFALPTLEAPQGGHALYSATAEDGFCQLSTDATEVVQAAMCCLPSARQFPLRRLSALPGLPLSYLNDMLSKYDRGRVLDLWDYVSEPWASLLYHDAFPALHSRLLDTAAVELQGPASRAMGQALTGARAQDAVVDFVKQNTAALPRYAVPISA